MKKKLTLTIDEDVLPQAKEFARRRGVSLSRLVENALREMSAGTSPSFSRQWRGKFQPADHDEERYRVLARKYL